MPVLVAQDGFGAAFRMGHQAQHVAGGVANAGDVIEGAVGIGLFRHGVGVVIILGVGNGDSQHAPGFIAQG